jgi:hypothetical protein
MAVASLGRALVSSDVAPDREFPSSYDSQLRDRFRGQFRVLHILIKGPARFL